MELKEWMVENTPLTCLGIYDVLDKIQELESKEKAENNNSPLRTKD